MRTICRSIIALTLPAVSACDRLPAGIDLRVAATDDIVLTVDEGTAFVVRQPAPSEGKVIISNIDGTLSVTQLSTSGAVPVSLEIAGPDSVKMKYILEDHVLIDEDGNGIPDMRIDDEGKYRLKIIEWELIPNEASDP